MLSRVLLLAAAYVTSVTFTEASQNMMTNAKKRPLVDETKCPLVKPMRQFNLNKVQGPWTVQQYYASSEEALSYRCMRSNLEVRAEQHGLEVHMNFSYSYLDDPDRDVLLGNITWVLPDVRQSAHWVHAEDTYEGVYNTYVLDTDYASWLLLLHCAEKTGSPRYLSSLLMSRSHEPLGENVLSYLRDKLQRYGVVLEYLFPMQQEQCPQQYSGVKEVKRVKLPAFKRSRK